MTKCAYRRCDKEVLQNPKSRKKFCCEKHGTAEREIIRWEKLRKPRIKRRCRYRLCGITFKTGNYSKLHCCTKHRDAEKRLGNAMINLIERAARENFVIRPCHDDWSRSTTIQDGKLVLWFNVPTQNGWTTKIIREE